MKKYFNHLIWISALAIIRTTSFGQTGHWQESSKWTIYSTRGAKFYKIPLDSLIHYPSQVLNDDSMHMFLARSTVLPADKPPVWMGAFVASCSIKGKIRKIDISQYSTFFFDEEEQNFYQIPESLEKEWLKYLTNSARSTHSN